MKLSEVRCFGQGFIASGRQGLGLMYSAYQPWTSTVTCHLAQVKNNIKERSLTQLLQFILLADFSHYFDIGEHVHSPCFYLIVIKTSSDFLQELIRIIDQQRNLCSWILYKVTFHDSLIKIKVVVLFNYEICNLISAFLSGKY